ncbi:hypothetical protein [uncultured Friedmanniella sp.]|uniref:hypothetical protein n=1 Tax=uncultured Friedmanniella sp. TaxID=335381 RepID=UPI0035CB410A
MTSVTTLEIVNGVQHPHGLRGTSQSSTQDREVAAGKQVSAFNHDPGQAQVLPCRRKSLPSGLADAVKRKDPVVGV